MDPLLVIAAIANAINAAAKLVPHVVNTANDVKPFAQAIYNMFDGTKVSQEQLDVLEAEIARLSANLQRPLVEDPMNESNR